MLAYHRQLIGDTVRIEAFRKALRETVRPTDVVLDVGAGTGILSLLACEAGARHVYAIEQHHSADAAALLARQFGLEQRISVIHARSHEIELPERATLLVSDTLGPLVFNEGWLGMVADARRRLLVPEARFIPSHVDVWIAAAELPELYADQIGWWETPRFGFDFSSLRLFAANSMIVTSPPREALISEPAGLMKLAAADVDDGNLTGKATSLAARRGTVHGFVIGFLLHVAPGITVNSAWDGSATWQQAFLPLELPIDVEPDAPMSVSVDVAPSEGRWRWSGTVAGTRFDQTTLLSKPPCSLARR